MEIEFMKDLIMPMVLAGCLVIGYLLKNFAPGDNKWIPVIVTCLGAIFACFSARAIEFDIVIAGMVTGLASTGLHQLLKETFGLGKTKTYEKHKD